MSPGNGFPLLTGKCDLVSLATGVLNRIMTPQLDLLLTPSCYVARACEAAHWLALCAVPFTRLDTLLQSLLATAILAALWHYRQRARRAVDVRIRLRRDGAWELALGDMPLQMARLATPVFVHPLLTVLRFRLADGRYCSALLLPDCVEAEDFRRLRVWLRYGLCVSD